MKKLDSDLRYQTVKAYVSKKMEGFFEVQIDDIHYKGNSSRGVVSFALKSYARASECHRNQLAVDLTISPDICAPNADAIREDAEGLNLMAKIRSAVVAQIYMQTAVMDSISAREDLVKRAVNRFDRHSNLSTWRSEVELTVAYWSKEATYRPRSCGTINTTLIAKRLIAYAACAIERAERASKRESERNQFNAEMIRVGARDCKALVWHHDEDGTKVRATFSVTHDQLKAMIEILNA